MRAIKILANLLLLNFIQPFLFFQFENKSNQSNETDTNSTTLAATSLLATTTTKEELNSLNDNEMEMASCPINQGTTPGLEEIVIGRCNNFLSIIQKTNCEIRVKNISCHAIWNEFRQAIVNKDPCNITAECFRNFISVGRHPIKRDTSIFWSGTKELTQQISKALGYFSLEDTLIGYIVDDLKFCSAKNQSSFTRTVCPEDCVTRNNPFWIAASVDFASRASGRAVAILNATVARGGAASNYTTFMRFEVPNLNGTQLKELKVILTGTPGQERFETCSQPKTLVYLEQLLKAKNITYSCQEDTIEWLDTRLILCFFQHPPYTEKCKIIRDALDSWI